MNKTTSIILSLVIGLVIGGGAVMAYQKSDGGNANMMGHDMSKMNSNMPTNMNSEMDSMMAGLKGKTGEEFDKTFMTEMIMHHQGAINMANSALQNAKHQEIKDLAKNIISAQTSEIKMMQDWQTKWYGSASAGLRVEDNAIVVNDQKPGNVVSVSQVYLSVPGYVVIHEMTNGKVGAVIGSSSLLQAGTQNNVPVKLIRSVKNGEEFAAMLHAEKDGNSSFDVTTDTPIQSKLGGPIMMMFSISSTANEGGSVSI